MKTLSRCPAHSKCGICFLQIRKGTTEQNLAYFPFAYCVKIWLFVARYRFISGRVIQFWAEVEMVVQARADNLSCDGITRDIDQPEGENDRRLVPRTQKSFGFPQYYTLADGATQVWGGQHYLDLRLVIFLSSQSAEEMRSGDRGDSISRGALAARNGVSGEFEQCYRIGSNRLKRLIFKAARAQTNEWTGGPRPDKVII